MRRYITIMMMILLSTIVAQGQIKIGGNVYGGGNHAEVKGSTKVTVLKGDIGAVMDPNVTEPLDDPSGKVFGGARMANVGGSSFVNIDGEHASGYILINQVFGGNDIAGQIGTAAAVEAEIPTELTEVGNTEKKNDVDNTFNSYVRISTKALTETYSESEITTTDPENPAYGKSTTDVKPDPTAKKVYIGQLFGGGNGDYTYNDENGNPLRDGDDYIVKQGSDIIARSATPFVLPEQDKTYLEIKGGSIVYGYGGGNNATVKEKAIIHFDNPSAVVNHIWTDNTGVEVAEGTQGAIDLLTTNRFIEMGINTTFSQPSSGAYQVGRFFGGNNKAEMSIRPTWNLLAGKIRNLYSGGNRGSMTSPEGLLLELKDYSTLIVDNLYGGCRMADVKPTVNGIYVPCMNLEGYYFPSELSARVLVSGGHVNNVYGGNDVTGVVYGGNAVGIHTTIYGDVYGGGNGAYPYTDNEYLQNDGTYADFYFDGGNDVWESLKAFRPNAEQVSLHLWGESSAKPTIIHGSVFVGGNCASLAVKKSQPTVELKIGSYVIADKVYLGNNGEGMIDKSYLEKFAEEGFNSWNLTDHVEFGKYMDAVAMTLMPSIVFDSKAAENGDRYDYKEYSSFIGSFFCGGNVGSMAIPGKMTFNINRGLNIYNKFVGGCNNADIPAQAGLNAAYNGGIIGSPEERDSYTDEAGNIKDRLEINFENLTVVPRRWQDTFVEIGETDLNNNKLIAGREYYTSNLEETKFVATGDEVVNLSAGDKYYKKTAVSNTFEWNTGKYSTVEGEYIRVENNAVNNDTRLLYGNVYGGCFNSGHVNGNVILNINDDVVKKDEIFGSGTSEFYQFSKSDVDYESQRDDVMLSAMYVYGAGHGKDTEIWGSTTINHNKGYAFQLFGGGEEGAVGKRQLNNDGTPVLDDGNYVYEFNPKYSTTVNLKGIATIYSHDGTVENLAEAEYLYGGGNEGIIAGNTLVNVGNGRIYDAFGGSSDADILGHAEVYVGRQPDGSGGYKDGFPWIRDNVYGGNDFGGTIHGDYEDGFDFTKRVRDYNNDKTQIYGYKANEIPEVLKGTSYVEYLQGRVDTIFGGSYGSYDYSQTEIYGEGNSMPKQHSAFVNIRPKDHTQNAILHVYGAGTGYPGNRDDDGAQNRSYVLIDIPDGMTNFGKTEVFGSGSYNGLGMHYTPAETFANNFNLDEASAVIDLLRGRIHSAYGGSYQEGITRRTVVNVPPQSSIQIDNIFGGAYGVQILPPCDVYETQVNYNNTSENAQVFGAIYGGNNNERRSLFTQVNISSPVYSNKEKGYTGTVYGAGRGVDTWSEHTEVNLLSGARVYNVFGGGEIGHVLNSASVQAYMNIFKENLSPQISEQDAFWKSGGKYTTDGNENRVPATDELKERWHKDWANAWTFGGYYIPGSSNGETAETAYSTYATNASTNLDRFSDRSEIDNTTKDQLDGAKKHNTNVIINKGAVVEGYAYGGGLGDASVPQSGDIYGSTYIAVLGGEVKKDVYAGGRAGGVDNLFGAEVAADKLFVATANAYIQGGTARNVYGGGYEGHVGYHKGAITTTTDGDRLAESYVVIGKTGTNTFDGGAPAITRNVYGGGEGGSVYGSSNVSINNGYIGYRAKNTGTAETPNYEYVEELDDQNPGDLELSGNVFGGGYVANSYVDSTTVNMYGGTVRGSLYGGGEIGPIGRGTMKSGTYTGALQNQDAYIFRAGTTNVNMFDGLVKRNVFGGGRGKDSWGGDGTLYMDPTVVATLDMKCKGYIFGQTHVNIHGGEIGTAEGMAQGYGNVFGGGDEGSVYSAYMNKKGVLSIGNKVGTRYDNDNEGYYYRWDGSNFIDDDGNTSSTKILSEDCKVVVEPYAKAFTNLSVGGKSYKTGEYVQTSDLNKLKGKNAETGEWESPEWGSLDSRGIIIHNAVFAGGNISSGSSTQNANDKTVFGNATASIHDVYNRDLITIGTGHTGGLYGDGNLTFVDGYRELNITNYGTDYQHIKKQLTYDQYKVLPEREQAYYELKYKCQKQCQDIAGTTYSVGSNLPMDELLAQFTNPDGTSVKDGDVDIIITDEGKKVPNPVYWVENGVVSVYAGRIMNTIQRADFCGVFGSRMVMKGAQDRVPEEADYTNYTINRVREVSLNKMDSKAGDTDNYNIMHGNYFGIYSVVNYLGALTSDVTFDAVRTTDNTDASRYKTPVTVDGTTYQYGGEDGASYYHWKQAHIGDRTRNNGSCHNQLALASGVYLELTTEQSTGNTVETKDWGPITGVVELDLINVQPGMGGGFVYAKNVHGVISKTNESNTTLTAYNIGAASKKDYTYDTTDAAYNAGTGQYQWESSGNFIHSTQTIIDDCYNESNRYYGAGKVRAHYWYIAGSVYVYDQYISAYTGSPNAFSETVEIPISISAASNGKMTLVDVQPNYYAYYKDASMSTPLSGDQKLVINDVTYQLNDPISYWDYNKLTAAQRNLFVSDTYILKDSCYIDSKYYPAGYVMLPTEYEHLKGEAADHEIDGKEVKAVKKATKDADGNPVVEKDKDNNDVYVAFYDAFRSSNNMSHDTGYLLTYNVTNPGVWDKWYTKLTAKEKITLAAYKDLTASQQTDYTDGPTYSLKIASGGQLLGQQDYDVNAIIPQTTHEAYEALGNHKPTSGQAVFTQAYLVTKECTSNNQHYYPGAPVSTEIVGNTAPAYVSTATIQLSPTEFIYVNDLMTEAQKTAYYNRFKKGGAEENEQIASDIQNLIKPAYICTTAGKYGGSYYVASENYRALEAYSAMSPEDRAMFNFNYDALDLLIDPAYGGIQGKKYQYDGKDYTTADEAKNNDATYSLPTPIDYTATYEGDETGTHNGVKLENGKTYSRAEFEALPNEQRHYAPIAVAAGGGTYYVVNNAFIRGDVAYAVGTAISSDAYGQLSTDEQAHFTELNFPSDKPELTYYYCREEYQINEKKEGVEPTVVSGIGAGGGIETRDDGKWVTVGTIINAATVGDAKGYDALPNYQTNFTIHGISPMETSTLYVARNADINDLSTEKIITVIYKYDYEESDEKGMHITPVTERHVVNIHINFKSGVPTVEDINPPSIVLPGTGITMRVPTVTPGAYEITGGGWEIFEKPSDAESHINGVPYTPSVDPLYWYQDGFYLAYYAKTYLGRTYSNHVPISVANYHDLKRVMDDKENHLHVDYDHDRLQRESKIYINDYSASSENALDLFKDFYDLSLLNSESTGVTDGVVTADGRLNGHHILNQVNGPTAGENLEFILRTDIDHPASWTTIGTDDICFKGNLHGDGHTISGLNNSLFYNLCGSVYNLGVTGSFNTAGVADKGTGYVESAWVKTTATEAVTVTKPYAVFGSPSDTEGYQVVNSYFWDGNNDLYATTTTNGITTSGGARGTARAMTAKEFYNGTVAYNLNNFYLYKRYSDQRVTSGDEDEKYSYFTIGNDGKLELQNNHYYTPNANLCSTGHKDKNGNAIMYVEDRFADGDFIFAAGEIPTTAEERQHTWTVTDAKTGMEKVESTYFPIWPDDYVFFGQKLTYGWGAEAHQNVPTAVVREDGRLSAGTHANRVYRAPAYYRSKVMGVAHFNPQVYLTQKEKLTTAQIEAHVTPREAYPDMTAIDFKGHNDLAYQLGLNDGKFYTPLLDDDGLLSIQNCDETQNLVVYAPAADANTKTHGVLNGYFTEPVYDDYYDNSKKYRLVAEAPSASVHGHLVQSDLKATNDHLLVDRQDFNAPIAYKLDADYLMWYQRIPADREFVDTEKGWQGISVPFTAELVTTNQKGEITHFYSGSDDSHNGTFTKKGHEYWLRQYNNIEPAVENVMKATFQYPNAAGAGKTVTNTFLWDYYYNYEKENVHYQQDKNDDTYLEYRQYYSSNRSYANYPLLSAATPYILGLPGDTYYEFDLSGKFQAQNTKVSIPKLGKQIITFASNTGAAIGVSDDEMTGVKHGNYTFKPSYMNETLPTGDFVMNSEGNAYVQLSSDATKNENNHVSTSHSAFRPYFTYTASASPAPQKPNKIIFGGANSGLEDGPETVLNGELEIYVKNHKIITTSYLKEATTITIFNVAGIKFANYVLKPGETVETPIQVDGVYIVNKKKLFVK